MGVKLGWKDSGQFEDLPDDAQTRLTRSLRSGIEATAADSIPPFLKDPDVEKVLVVAKTLSRKVRPQAVRRSEKLPEFELTVDIDDGADYMLIVRHPSGALTFHGGEEIAARRSSSANKKRAKKYQLHFRVPVTITADQDVRRNIFGRLIDAVVDVIIVKVTSLIAEKAINAAEVAIWKLLKRERGLFKISPKPTQGFVLKKHKGTITPGPSGRALLFIHGTFSTTQDGFGELSDTDFFDRIKGLYGDAIYGFDHFSVSMSPEQNALDLLAALPVDAPEIDVVTHSRGGLVLRNLVERHKDLRHGDRFRLGHAVLVASPNEGTPLATPGRWDDTIGWLANLLELFPPNPVTSNAAVIAHWITWFVKVGVDAAEGLDAMNGRGTQISELQKPPTPAPDLYSALVSNFEPDRRIWARAIDLGVDAFFGQANDLVVPTAGGWNIDGLLEGISADNIGVFGPGGNISENGSPVSHVGFFSRPESHEFISRALSRQPQGLTRIEPGKKLPSRRRLASEGFQLEGIERSAETEAHDANATPAAKPYSLGALNPSDASIAPPPYSPVFELTVIDYESAISGKQSGNSSPDQVPFLFASYGGARVTVPFPLKNRHFIDNDDSIPPNMEATAREVMERWRQHFQLHTWIREYLDQGARPPPGHELEEFGNLLFETLFPAEVRRLYDVARAREKDKLFLVFTSMIPWVFDMPWEFSRDVSRGTYLATEDVHFIRNVLTPTPVEVLQEGKKLRMLIASAAPAGVDSLSLKGEVDKVKSELGALVDEGLIEIQELRNATIRRTHEQISIGNYDVFHFIGHGYWEPSRGEAGLVLEDELGQISKLGGRSLREVLSGRGIRLAFLNACNTGAGLPGLEGSSLAGAAQDLFGRGVPNVIANQFSVGDTAAVAFARSIYAYLAKGKSVAQAVREARISASYVSGSEPLDWAIPVVYARNPEERLVKKG